MDIYSKEKRSKVMAAVRGRDTAPEKLVRNIVHRAGYRYRLHRRDLPGRPDLVFPRHRKIIFVHGCFWHQHKGCAKAKIPKTNYQFWQDKLCRNVERDEENIEKLEGMGWKILVIWVCELKDIKMAENRIYDFLES